MERKYLSNLINWLNNPLRKPLLIYGARQVGKTTLIKDLFAKKYFEKYIYIDFKIDVAERIYIKNHIKAKDIITYLEMKNNITIDKDTLIIFDEVQECIPCLTALKYFSQDYPDIPVIATGSMIRIRLKQLEYEGVNIKLDPEITKENQDGHNNYMFPTGKINTLDMYPMTFNEFLKARNSKLYDFIKESYKEKKVLEDEYHKIALEYIYDYIVIGGMPEAVDVFIKTSSYVEAKNTLKTLYNDYLNDFTLFQISQETIMRTKKVFDNIYLELNKENKNFKISLIEEGKRYRDYMYPFDWLESGRIIYKSHLLKENITLPLRESSDSLFRVYLADPGLLALQTGISTEKIKESISKNDYRGLLFENFVAGTLRSHQVPLFYWMGKTSSELEFFIVLRDEIIPIDVKKTKGKLSSLENYRTHNKNKYAIKISSNKYGYSEENSILTLPFYYLEFFIEENENLIFKKD